MKSLLTLTILTLLSVTGLKAAATNDKATVAEKPEEAFAKAFEDTAREVKSIYAQFSNEQKTQAESLREGAPDPNKAEAIIGIEIDVKSKRESIKMHIPQFYSKREEIKFDVPKIVMRRKHIFDIPEFRGLKIYRKKVYGNWPEFRSERKRISFDVPTVRFILEEIKYDIPQFKVKEVKAEVNNYQEQVSNFQKNHDASKASLNSKVLKAVEKGKAKAQAQTKYILEAIDKELNFLEKTVALHKECGKPYKGLLESYNKLKKERNLVYNQLTLVIKNFDQLIPTKG